MMKKVEKFNKFQKELKDEVDDLYEIKDDSDFYRIKDQLKMKNGKLSKIIDNMYGILTEPYEKKSKI